MRFTVPGFPTEISERIELPNIAELLHMPFFANTSADDFRKMGTDFQRYLLDRVNLRNDTRHVTVLFNVHLLSKNKRSLVNISPNSKGNGWHIDGEDDSDDYSHFTASERVFLLLSPCTALTEFNKNSFTVTTYNNLSRSQLNNHILDNFDEYEIVPQAMEPERIVTFTNHLHRAVDPQGDYEFRLEFRVRETNRKAPPSRAENCVRDTMLIWDGVTGERVKNIEKESPDKIVIYY